MAEESIGTARIDVVVNSDKAEAQIKALERGVSQFGSGAADQYNKASTSAKKYADSLTRQAEMLGKTRAEQIAYNAQTRVGGELGDKIAAKALAQQTAMAAGLGATGKSVKELQFAMRGLPAQITDIGVSLASGQRPMMVLLQQGGQLKDMFGGIVPAAKALGGSLLALINPYTLTAAAAAALFLVFKRGEDETTAFNKAMILTGNYAGQTTDSLATMAKSLSGVATTQHQAAAVLSEVASSGKFTASQIALVGQAAVDMSRLTGQAVKDTIKQFSDLQNEPLKAVMALDEAQHFLTTAIYEQIKALEDQGRTQEAANLASRTYANTIADRTAEVTQNLGLIEQSWNGIKNAAKQATDAALGFGRQQTGQEQFDALAKKRDELLAMQTKGTRLVENDKGFAVPIQDEIDAYTKQLADLQDARIAAEKQANQKSLASQATLALEQSDAEAAQYATNAEKRNKEVLAASNKANAQLEKALAVGDTASAERIAANYTKIVGGIDAKYADKRKKKVKDDSIPGTSATDVALSLAKTIDGYKKEADQWARSTQAATAYRQTLQDMLDTRKRAIDLQVQSIGMGQREIDQQQALISIDEDYNRKKAELQRRQQSATSQLDKAGFQQQLDDLKTYHDNRISIEMDGWRRSTEARKNAMNGARAAIADFIDNASNAAGQTYDLFSNAFDGMSDALAKFVATGKLDFSDMVESFITDMARMEMRILASQVLESIFGNSTESIANAGISAQIARNTAAMNWSPNAFGNVFNTPSLSAYSNSIVDKPTFFANGGNVMGEAGPEAIMPLTRGPNGKLGVQASGGESPQVEINITNNGQPVQARQTGQRMDGKKMIVDLVLDAVANDVATGGKVAKAGQQRFGWQRRGVPV